MLRIRPEQTVVLAEAARGHLISRLCAALRRAHGHSLDRRCARSLDEFVQNGFGRAESHGITDIADVEEFLHLLVEHDENMPDTQWAREILGRSDLLPFEKVTRLSQQSAIIGARGQNHV